MKYQKVTIGPTIFFKTCLKFNIYSHLFLKCQATNRRPNLCQISVMAQSGRIDGLFLRRRPAGEPAQCAAEVLCAACVITVFLKVRVRNVLSLK